MAARFGVTRRSRDHSSTPHRVVVDLVDAPRGAVHGVATQFFADVDQAASVDHEVRCVQDVALGDPLGALVVCQLVVGRTHDCRAAQAGDGLFGQNATQRAWSEDVGRFTS